MTESFGGKWIICIALLGSGLINLITPLISSSFIGLNISRVILGICQSGTYPAAFGLLMKWLPRSEKSFGFALLDVGGEAGSVATSSLAGYLSDYGFAGGWPSAFYVPGIVGIASFLVFVIFVTSSPETHKLVTIKELNYIKGMRGDKTIIAVKPTIPWKAILTSKPVLALVYGRFTLGWSVLVLDSKLPTYLSKVLHVDATMVN